MVKFLFSKSWKFLDILLPYFSEISPEAVIMSQINGGCKIFGKTNYYTTFYRNIARAFINFKFRLSIVCLRPVLERKSYYIIEIYFKIFYLWRLFETGDISVKYGILINVQWDWSAYFSGSVDTLTSLTAYYCQSIALKPLINLRFKL